MAGTKQWCSKTATSEQRESVEGGSVRSEGEYWQNQTPSDCAGSQVVVVGRSSCGSELIHTGYREACGSVNGCLNSWTYVHNETVNIYSHIIGAAIFLILPICIFSQSIPPRYAIATLPDILVCSIYLLGVAVCFILSTTFHTFMSHSESLYLVGMQLDILGVLALMWSSTIPLIHYSFPCQTLHQGVYTFATTTLATICAAATSLPSFHGPALGRARAALFATFGIVSFAAPLAHGAWVSPNGWADQAAGVGLPWIGMTAVCNGVGVVAYSLKFPEKWFPRRFDLFGASHQIMHIMVLLAALAYARAIVAAFDYRHDHGMAC